MKLKVMLALVLMASGRAMTLAFIGRAGDGGVGDPPAAWLMPLIGDAAIGLAAVAVALMIWKRPTAAVWTIAVTWSAIGAFDALAAFVVETTAPWPEFFMLEIFGRSMFFAATAMHLAIIYLLTQSEVLRHFGLQRAHNTP
ncbi:MAG: hypothetical protein ACI8TP_000059 [Acidimicrobiales bacterium]|jgi:hypothetical protein